MTATSAKPQQVLPKPVQLLTVPKKTEAAKRKTFTPRDSICCLVKLRSSEDLSRLSTASWPYYTGKMRPAGKVSAQLPSTITHMIHRLSSGSWGAPLNRHSYTHECAEGNGGWAAHGCKGWGEHAPSRSKILGFCH